MNLKSLLTKSKSLLLLLLLSPSLSAAEVTGNSSAVVITSTATPLHHIRLISEDAIVESTQGRFVSEEGFVDGLYRFEVYLEIDLTQTPQERTKNRLNDGRNEAKRSDTGYRLFETGSFRLQNGMVLLNDKSQKEPSV